jgi:hypothetical protein
MYSLIDVLAMEFSDQNAAQARARAMSVVRLCRRRGQSSVYDAHCFESVQEAREFQQANPGEYVWLGARE